MRCRWRRHRRLASASRRRPTPIGPTASSAIRSSMVSLPIGTRRPPRGGKAKAKGQTEEEEVRRAIAYQHISAGQLGDALGVDPVTRGVFSAAPRKNMPTRLMEVPSTTRPIRGRRAGVA